jgi:predicted dehydrogenase
VAAARETAGFLALGYNRRFSPHARAVREAFAARTGPLAIRYRVAPGPPPQDSWITEPRVGGGRIVGEVCHFVDLCTYLVGVPPETVHARALGVDPDLDDSLVAVLGFPDRSTAVIEYLAHASPALPKERFEVSGDGRTAICDDFRTTRAHRHRTLHPDKGQAAAIAAVLEAIRDGRPSPFGLEEIAAVSKATFAMLEAVRSGREARIEP